MASNDIFTHIVQNRSITKANQCFSFTEKIHKLHMIASLSHGEKILQRWYNFAFMYMKISSANYQNQLIYEIQPRKKNNPSFSHR